MVLSEGTMEKFQVTPPGIDPGTVRLVAQRIITNLSNKCQTHKGNNQINLEFKYIITIYNNKKDNSYVIKNE